MKRLLIFGSILLTLAAGSVQAQPLPVQVSIAPQKYFVEKIAGPLAVVGVLVPPGADAHVFEPKPSQMVQLAKARVFFSIGFPWETNWLPKITASNSGLQVVAMDRDVPRIPMPAHHHEDGDGDHEKISPDAEHKDGDKPGEDHEAESGLDPHVWLSPSRVRIMAGHVLTTLKNLDPAHALVYEENHRRFMDEIQALDQDLKTVLGPFKGQSFLVYHPAWGYLADDYGLKQVAVEVEGKEPKPAQLAEMIDHAKEAGIRMIFAQPQMSPKSAQVIAQAVGGRVVMGDPMAEDWAGNLRRMAQQISGKQP